MMKSRKVIKKEVTNITKSKIFITLLLFAIICMSGCGTNEAQKTTIISSDTSSVLSPEFTDTASHEDSETDESDVETNSSFTSETTVSTVSSQTEPKRNKITVVSSEPQPESKVESQKEGKEVHIGDKITTDFGEMSIESYKLSKKLDYTITNLDGTTVSAALDADEGKTFLIFTGIYKNTSGDELSPTISSGNAIINDEYEYSYLFFESDNYSGIKGYAGGLDPLESNRYYGRLEVPDEAINTLTKCEVSFTFRGGKSNDYKGEKYRLIITR